MPKFALVLALALLFPPAHGRAVDPPDPDAQSVPILRAFLSHYLHRAEFSSAIWGIKIVSLDTGKTLFEHNPQTYVSPASNTKLFTSALALHRLGPDYRIRTALYSHGRLGKDGTLDGDLIVYGGGDPGLNRKSRGGDLLSVFDPFVALVKKAGIKRISGAVVADASFFRGPSFGSGWAIEDLQYSYGALVSPLCLDDNLVELTVKPGASTKSRCVVNCEPDDAHEIVRNQTETEPDFGKPTLAHRLLPGEGRIRLTGGLPAGSAPATLRIPAPQPVERFAAVFRLALVRAGISVGAPARATPGVTRRNPAREKKAPGPRMDFGFVESAPLSDIIGEILKRSQNLYADMLLAHLGSLWIERNAETTLSSEEAGVDDLNRFLAEAGIHSREVLFEEGSGLSRDNLCTAGAVVGLLEFMSRHPHAEVFRGALPVAGVDGTLAGRMTNTIAAGNVQAKTGTLRWVSSLSGYVTTVAGEKIAFALLLNRYNAAPPNARASSHLDKIATLLAGLQSHSRDWPQSPDVAPQEVSAPDGKELAPPAKPER